MGLKTIISVKHRHTATARPLEDQGMSVSHNSFCHTVSALGLAGEDLRMMNLFPHWFGMAHLTNHFFECNLARLQYLILNFPFPHILAFLARVFISLQWRQGKTGKALTLDAAVQNLQTAGP